MSKSSRANPYFTAPIKPVVIRLHLQLASQLYVRIKAGEAHEALESLKIVYQKFNPDYPL
jgi:hypothetical protein